MERGKNSRQIRCLINYCNTEWTLCKYIFVIYTARAVFLGHGNEAEEAMMGTNFGRR